MLYAKGGFIPYVEWEHEPDIRANNTMTVAMFLTLNGIMPPH